MAIDIGQLDPDFKNEVAARPGAENVQACFTCGVCTAGCPVSEVDERYSPRQLIRMIVLGMREELLSSELLWLCNSCYNCYAHCPQDVKFTDVVQVLREMAVEEGYADPEWLERIERVDCMMQEVRSRLLSELAAGEAEPEGEGDAGDKLRDQAVDILNKLLAEQERGEKQ